MCVCVCVWTLGTYVFQLFFKSLTLIVIFGGAHGLLLLPALLSIVGGDKADDGSGAPPRKSVVERDDAIEMQAVTTESVDVFADGKPAVATETTD